MITSHHSIVRRRLTRYGAPLRTDGGAIVAETGSALHLVRPIFRRNHAQSGGAFATNFASAVELVDPTFVGNAPAASTDCAYFAVGGTCTCRGAGCEGCCANVATPDQTLTVLASNITHKLRRHDLGCHSDLGYSHQPRGLYSQMVYSSSFEPEPVGRQDGVGWSDVSTAAAYDVSLDKAASFHGEASQRIEHRGGAGRAGVANRGHGNEGLVFASGETYEGYLFARSAKGAELVVSLEDWSDNNHKVLASTTLAVPASPDNWTRLEFSFLSQGATSCQGIRPLSVEANASNITCQLAYAADAVMSDRSAHICVKCGGQIVLALHEASTVNLDFVYVQPGERRRFAGLPVLKESMDWLQAMGTSLFRCGGSFASSGQMGWKRWRGKPWLRPSRNDHWGHDLLGG